MTAQEAPKPTGLSAATASERLRRDGPNLFPTETPTPLWRRFAAELIHFFALLFWVAGALAFVAGLPELGIAIFVVIILNGVFAFIQEERASRAAQRIRQLLPRRSKVIRDGVRVEIPAEDLVVGDLVLLEGGDRVSADLLLETTEALAIDTSTLTGESVTGHPSAGEEIFAGTFVVEGEASGVVTATGTATRLAEIARLTRSQRPEPSPLHLELTRLSRVIAVTAIGVGTGFFAVSLLLGMKASNGFLFAVGVTVALVPEGLLPTVTLSLANGARKMADRSALVRHLEAVETLGSTTFICTDKTGTLTRNEMEVVEVWMPNGSALVKGVGYRPEAEIHLQPESALTNLEAVAKAAARCSTARIALVDGKWIARGDPMEAAIDALAQRVGIDQVTNDDATVVKRFPFDPIRRRMSVVTSSAVYVKGAPDALLPLCREFHGADRAVSSLAARGLRVLAVAKRDRNPTDAVPRSWSEAERDLELLGLLAFEDPPREGVARAIATCRRAGIKVAMVTGDHPATAEAVAGEVGLSPDRRPALIGKDLPRDDDDLGRLIDRDGVVIARVSPEDKLRIARALHSRQHVVAMTGDGVNDAPALREAAIGVAMGMSGTDVAREAADLVLLDDNFSTIVAAVEQGRSTFANIRRFLTYHLTDNVAELAPFVAWALSRGRFPLALGVLQVLALDIGTDVLPSLALGAEPPAPYSLDRPPIRRHLLDRHLFVRAFGVLGPSEAVVALAAFMAVFLSSGWVPGEAFPGPPILLAASGAAFSAVVFGQMANAFACRSSTVPVWGLHPGTNRLLLGAVLAEAVMLACFLYLPPLPAILGQQPPTLIGIAVSIAAFPVVIAADTAQKSIAARIGRR